jgi:hypothetical protein
MTVGAGGKYEAECAALLLANGAQCACVIVMGGRERSGFSVSTVNPAYLPALARTLRDAAEQIEADVRALKRSQGEQ